MGYLGVTSLKFFEPPWFASDCEIETVRSYVALITVLAQLLLVLEHSRLDLS